jgi:hypothetical protein
MRRTIITAVALTALAVPCTAVASHQSVHQAGAGHHGVQHKRHHRHAHLVRFGIAASTQAAGPTGPTSSPSPTAPAAPTGDTAGTVASFTNGTLTITLNDGSTVSGKVTEGTEIECHSAMASAASDGQGGQVGQGDQGGDSGNEGQSGSGSGDGHQGDVSGHDGGDDGEAQQEEAGHCTSAALVTGAVVREAELRVSSAGAVWEKVELNQ